jgi:hypothetical protein
MGTRSGPTVVPPGRGRVVVMISRSSYRFVLLALEAYFILGLLASALRAQEPAPAGKSGGGLDLLPLSSSTTQLTLGAAAVLIGAKSAEVVIKIIDYVKTRGDNKENASLVKDNIKLANRVDRAEDEVRRKDEELKQLKADHAKCEQEREQEREQDRERIDYWKGEYYKVREELAPYKRLDPPSSPGSSRIGPGINASSAAPGTTGPEASQEAKP